MGADYLVWMQDPEIATLMAWDPISETWETLTGTLAFHFETAGEDSVSDLYLPFSALNITDPANTDLSLVAFATEEQAMRLWATMPPRNPVNSKQLLDAVPESQIERFSLLQAYTWPSLGPNVCPNGSQAYVNLRASGIQQLTQLQQQPAQRFTGADVRWNLAAEPSGITYSVLEDNLFNIMDDVFTDMTDWEIIDRELCDLFPDDPECKRGAGEKPNALYGPARVQSGSGSVDFNAEEGLGTVMDVTHPAVGDSDTITYAVRYVNRGTQTATGLKANVATWGPVRLLESEGAQYFSETWDGQLWEWYELELPLGDLAPGAAMTATFTGIIDLTFDVENSWGLASVDVIFYDATGSAYENQLDWFYIDHRIDEDPPSLSLDAFPALVGPGQNVIAGTVSDQSAVPTITLSITDALGYNEWVDCYDATPEDGEWSCTWDASDAFEGDVVEIGARAVDEYGHESAWVPIEGFWYTFTVDATAPQIALSAATQEALADGVVGPDELNFSGSLADNRLVNSIAACTGDDCDMLTGLVDEQAALLTTHTYDDAPATSIKIDATRACEGGQSIVRTFEITESFTVDDVALGLNLEHDFRFDVDVKLTAPSGMWANVVWYGTSGKNYDVLLRDRFTALNSEDEQDHDISEPYFDNERHPDEALALFYGEPAQGTWTIEICDYFPEEDDGAYHRSRLILYDYKLPQNTQADWAYTLALPEPLDNVPQTLTLTGLDSVGNRSAPLTITLNVDTVAPIVTVTQALTEALAASGMTILAGEISDGSAIAGLDVLVRTEDGTEYLTRVDIADDGIWSYTLDQPRAGRYTLWIHAKDVANNEQITGPYQVTVIAPPTVVKTVEPPEVESGGLVTYTLTLQNPNPGHPVAGMTITDVLPTEVTPLAPLGTAYLPPIDNTLVWQDLSLEAGQSYTLAFTALVTNDTSLIGTHIVNTATFTSNLGGGVTPEASFLVVSTPPIYFVRPTYGQIFTATAGVSVTVPIQIATADVTIPGEGYWQLWSEGTQVISRVLTYTTSIDLAVGTHTLSATLYTLDDTLIGSDEVAIHVINPNNKLYLPLVLRSAP